MQRAGASAAGEAEHAATAGVWHPALALGHGLALAVVFYALVDEGQALLWDNGAHNLPLTLQTARQWFEGRLPAWNPFLWSGSPLLADPQALAFYPPALIAHFLTRDDPLQSMRLLCAFQIAIAATGASLASRRYGCSQVASFTAAAVFALNLFAVTNVLSFVNVYGAAAWLPWQVVALDLLVTADRPGRWLLPAGLAVALGWLAGYPGVWIFGGMFAALLTLARVPAETFWRRVWLIPLAYGVGLGLALFQVLPFLWLGFTSNRLEPPLQRGPGFPLLDLTGMLVPGLLTGQRGVFSVGNLTHLGILPVTLAILALARANRLRVALAVLTVGGILLAMGADAGVSRLLFKLPVLGLLRKPDLFFLVWVAMGVGLLGAIGLDDLLRSPRRFHVVGISMAVVAAVVVFLVYPPRALASLGDPDRQRAAFAVGVITAAGVVLGVRLGATRVVGVLTVVGVLGVLLVECSAYAARNPTALTRYAVAPDPTRWQRFPSSEPAASWRRSDGMRAYWGFPITERRRKTDLRLASGAYWNVEMASGYSGLVDPVYARAVDYFARGQRRGWLSTMNKRNRVLDVLSTPYMFVSRDIAPARVEPKWFTVFELDDVLLVTRRRALPRVRSVTEVRRADTRNTVIRQLRKNAFPPARVAVLDTEDAEAAAIEVGTRDPCAVRVGATAPGEIEVSADCAGPGFLVFSERSFPGWVAEVDGRRVPVVRVYGLVLGVEVPRGTSTVTLAYRPPGFRAGLGFAVVLAALLSGLAIFPRRHESERGAARRTDRTSPPSARANPIRPGSGR